MTLRTIRPELPVPARLAGRVGRPDLDWVLEALVPAYPGVRVTIDEPPPPGYLVADELVLVASPDSPMLLVSRGPRVPTWRMLASHLRLRGNGDRALRAWSAAGIGVGSRFPVVRVCVRDEARGPDGPLLLDAVRAQLPVAGIVVTLGRSDPNRKPTVELFDRAGAAIGYLKVGWNDATRDLVRAEAVALERVAAVPAGPDLPSFAPPLLVRSWRDRILLVSRPLPPSARRWPVASPTSAETVIAVARAFGDRPGRPGPHQDLAELDLWQSLAHDLAAAAFDDPGSDSPTVLADTLRAAREAGRGQVVEVAGWHGDWSPWNLAREGRRTWVFDLEHAGTGVPVGLDAVNWEFQVATAAGGGDAAAAVPDLIGRAPELLASYGYAAPGARALVTIYLALMWLRGARLERGGSGRNPLVEPGIADAMRGR